MLPCFMQDICQALSEVQQSTPSIDLSTYSVVIYAAEQKGVKLPKPPRLCTMYSAGQKAKVSYYARHHDPRAATRHFSVHHKNVERWMKASVDEMKNPKKRKNKKGQGRKISYPQEIDEKLMAWVMEKREETHISVSTQVLRLKALSLIKPVLPSFKASDGWLRKFLRRHNLVLRARTSIAQLLPADLEAKLVVFRQNLRQIRENGDFPYAFIANMDETLVYFDMVAGKTIDRKGKKSITVCTTKSEKRHITAVLCCTALGHFLPPMIIFKGKTPRAIKGIRTQGGTVVKQQENAWMDAEGMLKWIREI